MGSLNDGSDFGARRVSQGARYGHVAAGPGRWIRIAGVGVLWTDDADALQLAPLPGSDEIESNSIRRGLHRLAEDGTPAQEAFDMLADRYGLSPVAGDLDYRPSA